MLALDSPRWSELRHAYGTAADLPTLRHQGDVYTASYELEPELVPEFMRWVADR